MNYYLLNYYLLNYDLLNYYRINIELLLNYYRINIELIFKWITIYLNNFLKYIIQMKLIKELKIAVFKLFKVFLMNILIVKILWKSILIKI